jgi:ABC-type uncharacterized transport system permease subunit
MRRQHWQDWLTAIVGIWTFITPWVLVQTAPAATTGTAVAASAAGSGVDWSFHLVGLAIAIVGIAAIAARRLWEEWVDVVLGAWLLASPWILKFTDHTALTWNALIMGAVVVILSAWVLMAESRPGRPERHA